MLNNSLYDMIFKRKSFHLFRDTGDTGISSDKLRSIEETWQSLVPLCPGIRTAIRIVPAGETTCKRGQQACILLYSERKDHYLQNIGYLGEQLELSLVSQNIGTLWYGIGKAPGPPPEGLDFVIMIAIAKIDDGQKFRKDLFRSKRKPVGEIWRGEPSKASPKLSGLRRAPATRSRGWWNAKAIPCVCTACASRAGAGSCPPARWRSTTKSIWGFSCAFWTSAFSGVTSGTRRSCTRTPVRTGKRRWPRSINGSRTE